MKVTLPQRVGIGLAILAAVAAALCGAALGFIALRQEALLFAPQVLDAGYRFDRGPDVRETWVDVPGARLNALHMKLPKPVGVVFFLHGNGGSLDSWFVDIDFYRRANFDLFMIDYRGYGKSSGRIENEAQLHADARAAWQQIAPQYAGLRRVFLGRSLGSGLAAALAADVQPELTILVSPYISMQALAAEHYPWVPSALLRYPLRTDQALPHIRGELLLVHGDQDRLIPPAHSQALLRLAPNTQAARLAIVPGAAHNNLQKFPVYREQLLLSLRP